MMNCALVVETTPLTFDVSVNELVEVETVSTLVVPALIIDCRSVEVATPLMVEVSIVPEDESELEVMILEVATDPPMFAVSVLPLAESELGTEMLVKVAFVPTIFVVVALIAERLVDVVLVATIFARLAVPVAVIFVPVAFPKSEFVILARADEKKFVRKLPEFTMFCEVVVPVRFRLLRVPIVVVDTTPFTLDTREFAASAV